MNVQARAALVEQIHTASTVGGGGVEPIVLSKSRRRASPARAGTKAQQYWVLVRLRVKLENGLAGTNA
jgi:hypothetical protein